MRYKYIHVLAALFLIVGMAVQVIVTYRHARRNAQEMIDLKMQVALDQFRFSLHDAYDAADQMEAFVADNLSKREKMYDETLSLIKRYPNFYSCYVSFPEYYYPDEGRWFSPCSYRIHDSIYTIKFGDELHDYFTREWYKGAVQSGDKGYWSQPYVDEDFDETIFTFSNDMVDEDGNLICIVALDFSVSWMKQLLEEYKPFDEAVCMIYNSNGKLLTTSDNLKERDPSLLTEDRWMLSRLTLDPVDIDIVFAVPRAHIWQKIWLGILLPFVVFVLGIMVVGVLIRRMLRDQMEKAGLQTEKEVVMRELHIANKIQMGILRHDFPNDKDVEVNAALLPMLNVGGDLYDFSRQGDFLWFIIGDVSGKGVPAALFMSATVNLFRSALGHQTSPKAIVEEMNKVLSDKNPSLTFVTAFIGRLHIPSGHLLFCNAAHMPPLVRDKACNVKRIEMEPNIPLGYKGNYKFVEESCALGENEKLVLYSDGVTEARNEAHKMMGDEVWMKIVANDENLLESVKQYIGKGEPSDDITLMTIYKKSAVS